MNPFVLFILAILSPVILAAVIFVPPYVGIALASYIIYYKAADAVHPLSGKLGDVFYMIDVYSTLFSQWAHHLTETSILTYALPLLLMPIFGIMLSLWLGGKVARKLKDVFQMGMHI